MALTKTGFEFDAETHDTSAGTHRFEYDPDSTPPSMAVVSALASVLDVSPVSMRPLAEVIDTDALDRLVRDSENVDGAVEVSWTQADRSVTVSTDDTVTVAPPERDHGEPTVER